MWKACGPSEIIYVYKEEAPLPARTCVPALLPHGVLLPSSALESKFDLAVYTCGMTLK